MKRSKVLGICRNNISLILVVCFLILTHSAFSQQEGSVTGKVSNSDGQALTNVSVVKKGTQIGTITNENGDFSIRAVNGDVLVFSIVGFQTKEIVVKSAFIPVVLDAERSALDEVVVVGYGTQRKADLTGAISSVSADQLKERSNANVMSSISGKVSGVQIQQTQGAPGFAPVVKIRGSSTINSGNSPLYVVDGIPMEDFSSTITSVSDELPSYNSNPLSMINPSDIESIEILKDASSTAIYGSRGANGVVIITTKSGKEGKAKINVGYEKGLQQVGRKVKLMNSQQFIDFWSAAANNEWIKNGGSASDPQNVRPSNMQIPDDFLSHADTFRTTDWQDVTFRNAWSDNLNLSISGGDQKATYFISGNYLNQDGVVDRTAYERFTLRAKVNYQISKNFKAGVNMAFSKIRDRIYGTAGKADVVSLAIQNDPIFPVYNELGSLGFRDPGSTWSRFTPYELQQWHPYALTREADNYGRRLDILATSFLEYSFLNHFTFRTSLSGTYNTNRTGYYRNEGEDWGYSSWRPAEGILGTNENDNWLSENILSFNKDLGTSSKINAMVGYTAQKNHFESSQQISQGFPSDLVHTLNAGSPTSSVSEVQEWSLLSQIARVNYSYKDRYLVTGTVRRDGSSRFGKDNKWGYFPSFAFAWRLSEENFFSSLKSSVSSLKIRASYGKSGNNQIPNYAPLALLGSSQYTWDKDVQIGMYPISISNPTLKWEKSSQFDLGLDAGILNNRIMVEADYYYSRTKDLLLNVPIPSITGFTEQLMNIGKIQNQGFELSISSKNLVNEFRWNTDFNFSLNRNKIISTGPGNAPFNITEWDVITRFEVGHPIGSFYGYIFDGVFNNQEEINKYPHHPSTTPGDPIVRDVDGNGRIDENDRTFIGNAQPNFTFGMTNSFSYKGFDLDILIQGTQGNKIANQEARFSKRYNGGRNSYEIVSNYWRSEAEPGNGEIFKPYKSYPGLQTQSSTFFIEDGSYLRIANVRLGYNFSDAVLSKLNASSLRIYFNIDNLHVFSNYLGYDPENSTHSNDGAMTGIDFGSYPIPRTFTLGINLGF